MDQTACECRCDTCLDSDCEGHICKPHDIGKWVIVSPWMAHPLPTDFDSREDAQAFIDQLPIRRLSVEQVTAY
jgi:hypothetical protein